MTPQSKRISNRQTAYTKISRSRANANSRPPITGPITLKQLVTISLLPVWLGVVAVFDFAMADYHNQAISVSIPVDVSRLRREQDVDEIDDALRMHWVSTDQEGNLTGRISEIVDEVSGISPIKELEIVLLQRGKVQRKSEATDANGRFTLTDVKPGDYTLVASGPNGFLAYGVHVLPREVPFVPAGAKHDPESHQTYQYVSVAASNRVFVKNQDQFQIDAAAIPPQFKELERIVSGYLPTDAELSLIKNSDELKPLEDALKIARGFKFALDDDGSFSGRVLPPSSDGETVELEEMNIFLLQDDLEIHRTDVDKNGEFRIEEVDPGVYAVVAAGKDGFAALSFELVSADQDLSAHSGKEPATSEYYVAMPARPARVPFSIAIIVDPDDLKYCRQKIKELNQGNDNRQQAERFVDSSPPAVPIGSDLFPMISAGQTAPTGSFAGSGNFAANQGLQRFLRVSALTAAIVALGTIDGDNDVMSPVQP